MSNTWSPSLQCVNAQQCRRFEFGYATTLACSCNHQPCVDPRTKEHPEYAQDYNHAAGQSCCRTRNAAGRVSSTRCRIGIRQLQHTPQSRGKLELTTSGRRFHAGSRWHFHDTAREPASPRTMHACATTCSVPCRLASRRELKTTALGVQARPVATTPTTLPAWPIAASPTLWNAG